MYCEGERGSLPCPFLKIVKCALIWRKNALIVVIYGQHFSFKIFKSFQDEKPDIFFPVGPLFLSLQVNGSALIPRKLSCPKKFLVTCMKVFLNIFAKFTEKQSLSLWRLGHRCFPVNFVYFQGHLFHRVPLVDASEKFRESGLVG